jgi:hypothetical protein
MVWHKAACKEEKHTAGIGFCAICGHGLQNHKLSQGHKRSQRFPTQQLHMVAEHVRDRTSAGQSRQNKSAEQKDLQ